MVMNIMALYQGASAWFTKEAILGGGIGIFDFAVLILFFGFCARKLRFFGFGIHCRQRSFHFLAFGSRCSSKILMSFRMWKSMWFSVFPNWVWVSLRSGRQLCASTDIEQLRNLCMLHLSLLRRINQSGGFDNWDAKIYRFCMQFAVLMDFFLAVLVDSFYGFAISNRPQSAPHLDADSCSYQINFSQEFRSLKRLRYKKAKISFYFFNNSSNLFQNVLNMDISDEERNMFSSKSDVHL